MSKILYFTAGPVPTGPEQTAIDRLAIDAGAPHTVGVRNALVPAVWGNPAVVEDCDFKAGSAPAAYAAKPVYVAGSEARVKTGQVIPCTPSGNVTLTVVNGVITAAAYTA